MSEYILSILGAMGDVLVGKVEQPIVPVLKPSSFQDDVDSMKGDWTNIGIDFQMAVQELHEK